MCGVSSAEPFFFFFILFFVLCPSQLTSLVWSGPRYKMWYDDTLGRGVWGVLGGLPGYYCSSGEMTLVGHLCLGGGPPAGWTGWPGRAKAVEGMEG